MAEYDPILDHTIVAFSEKDFATWRTFVQGSDSARKHRERSQIMVGTKELALEPAVLKTVCGVTRTGFESLFLRHLPRPARLRA
jgi:hypothetical protein